MYYVLLPDLDSRTALIAALAAQNIQSVFHYVPLHSSPAGRRYGRAAGPLPVTEDLSDRLLRLPLWLGLEEHQVPIIRALTAALG
jgi:dTDP-4-amino-4,6-dideoxygalactose transaminase